MKTALELAMRVVRGKVGTVRVSLSLGGGFTLPGFEVSHAAETRVRVAEGFVDRDRGEQWLPGVSRTGLRRGMPFSFVVRPTRPEGVTSKW